MFLHQLPKLLCMHSHTDRCMAPAEKPSIRGSPSETTSLLSSRDRLQAALKSIHYIPLQVIRENEVREAVQNWKFVAQTAFSSEHFSSSQCWDPPCSPSLSSTSSSGAARPSTMDTGQWDIASMVECADIIQHLQTLLEKPGRTVETDCSHNDATLCYMYWYQQRRTWHIADGILSNRQ
ncbi:neuronal acetylcholine receptor subunit alpha-5 [Arapaima gigas]